MTDEQLLRSAFEEYNRLLCDELDKNLTDEVQPSEKLEKRMQKLFKRQKKYYYPLINTAFKRALSFALAAAFCFAVIAVSFPQISKLLDFYDGYHYTETPIGSGSNDMTFGSAEEQDGADHSVVTIPTLSETIDTKSDVFVAKVVSKEKAPENLAFTDISLGMSTPVVYTVEVTESLRSLCTYEGAEIKVVRLEKELDADTGNFTASLEKGKSYLIAATVQLMNDKPVLADPGTVTCEVKEDGSLVPMSKGSELYLVGLPTLDSFKTDADIAAVLAKEDVYMPAVIKAFEKTLDGTQNVADILKRAVDIDSDEKITVTPAQYEKHVYGLDDRWSLTQHINTMFTDRLCDSTDAFTATVISSEKLPSDTVFANIETDGTVPVLYTVEVTDALRSLAVESGIKINVVRLEKERDTAGGYVGGLEKGKSYFISGTVQLLEQKPVIVDSGELTCMLENGSLISIASVTDLICEQVQTYDSLVNDEERTQIINNLKSFVPDEFKALAEQSGGIQAVSDILKKAMPTDSTQTIKITAKK